MEVEFERKECGCKDKETGRRDSGFDKKCDNDKKACEPNQKHEKFETVVATWKTVRHYEINSYDTLEPVDTKCFNNNDDFEKCCCHMEDGDKCDRCKCH